MGNPQRVDVAVLYPSNRGNTVFEERKRRKRKMTGKLACT
jgi:hypothetical protein